MNLFQSHRFTSAAGLDLTWKIECESLTDHDWTTIARLGAKILPPFRQVVAVPRGGVKLANAIAQFSTSDREDAVLVVDDVWTTGKSMLETVSRLKLLNENWIGFVAFARGLTPFHVSAFMRTTPEIPH